MTFSKLLVTFPFYAAAFMYFYFAWINLNLWATGTDKFKDLKNMIANYLLGLAFFAFATAYLAK